MGKAHGRSFATGEEESNGTWQTVVVMRFVLGMLGWTARPEPEALLVCSANCSQHRLQFRQHLSTTSDAESVAIWNQWSRATHKDRVCRGELNPWLVQMPSPGSKLHVYISLAQTLPTPSLPSPIDTDNTYYRKNPSLTQQNTPTNPPTNQPTHPKSSI